MVVADLVHKGFQKPYGNLVGAIIIISVFREFAFHLEINRKTVFVADRLYGCILDG